jgi:hypothetical protein
MKALISPNEIFTCTWVASWVWDPPSPNDSEGHWKAATTGEITNCQRVAQVEPDNKIFSVAEPLYWVECPDNCLADRWYYKDGQVQPKPQNVSPPENPPEA